jgi:hypothetical protein
MQTAVSKQAQTSRIGRNDTPDMTRPLCAKIEREDEALLGQLVIGGLEYDTGISHKDAGQRVKRAYRVEIRQR